MMGKNSTKINVMTHQKIRQAAMKKWAKLGGTSSTTDGLASSCWDGWGSSHCLPPTLLNFGFKFGLAPGPWLYPTNHCHRDALTTLREVWKAKFPFYFAWHKEAFVFLFLPSFFLRFFFPPSFLPSSFHLLSFLSILFFSFSSQGTLTRKPNENQKCTDYSFLI